jgi:hypothetical protein
MLRQERVFTSCRGAASLSVCVIVLLMCHATPVAAQGSRYVDHDLVRQCGGNTPCYTTIQAAVDAASAGDTVYVYPGDYPESVDLSRMDPDGDIRIVTVDAGGSMTRGTATVGGAVAYTFRTTSPFDGDVSLIGFNTVATHYGVNIQVEGPGSESRDIEIRELVLDWVVTSNVWVKADGNVMIADCVGQGSDLEGIVGWRVGGNVEITNCTFATYFECAIYLWDVAGDVTISDSTAYDLGSCGILAYNVGGDVTIRRSTADFTYWGLDLERVAGDIEVSGCLLRDNQSAGISLWHELGGGKVEIHGNIICENGRNGLKIGSPYPVTLHAEGNWWGCAGGPGRKGCDSIDEGSGVVYFTPWINTISADTGGSRVEAGQPMEVRIRFSDADGTVFLGPGPGDPNGPPPFTVSTDNGILNGQGPTVGGFIEGSDGVLNVTLVPERAGTATLTVVGPCGLEGELTLESPLEEFVPEPGTVLLLGGGLMGLAAYAGLRLRER